MMESNEEKCQDVVKDDEVDMKEHSKNLDTDRVSINQVDSDSATEIGNMEKEGSDADASSSDESVHHGSEEVDCHSFDRKRERDIDYLSDEEEPTASRQRRDDPPSNHISHADNVKTFEEISDPNGLEVNENVNPTIGKDVSDVPTRTGDVAVENSASLGQAHLTQNPLRDIQFPQLAIPGMTGLQDNAILSQHLLNQQFMIGGHNQLPIGFTGSQAALSQFGMVPFHGQFNTVAGQGNFATQNITQNQEGAQQQAGRPVGQQQSPSASVTQLSGVHNNMIGTGMIPSNITPTTGSAIGQMAFTGGFGGRGGMMPVMAFGNMTGTGMPDATFQQMMLQRSGALNDADSMRQRMMFATMAGGAPGFRPNFLAAAGGRINNTSTDLRTLVNVPAQTHGQTPAMSLALSCDDEHLSEYQILVRKQLEIFEAMPEDVESNTQGRKKQVALGQVGIRCKHCASLPLRQRGRGAVYYPAKLHGVYQAAQNMASSHLCESCQCISESLKRELKTLRERRDTASGGKQYWADGARALRLFEAEDGLRMNREQQTQAVSHPIPTQQSLQQLQVQPQQQAQQQSQQQSQQPQQQEFSV
jgi:hypothetical protein